MPPTDFEAAVTGQRAKASQINQFIEPVQALETAVESLEGTKTVRNGAGAPSGGLGNDGDFYINVTANTLYGPKAAGSWGSPTSLVGPAGADGADGADGSPGATGATGATGPAGPAPGGTGIVRVTGGVLEDPATPLSAADIPGADAADAGQVPTSDGEGGFTWEDPAGGGGAFVGGSLAHYTSQNFADGVQDSIDWADSGFIPIFASTGVWSSANRDRLTAPADGVYAIVVSMARPFEMGSGDTLALGIERFDSGGSSIESNFVRTYTYSATGPDYIQSDLHLFSMNAGDFLRAQMTANGCAVSGIFLSAECKFWQVGS